MKSIIKTSLCIAALVIVMLNARHIVNECVSTYQDCVSFIVNNAYIPHYF